METTETHQTVTRNTVPVRENETIEWVGAGDGDKYMESATKWQEYTASKAFGEAFEQVMKQNHGDNETRSARME
jgi:hypothetical protein